MSLQVASLNSGSNGNCYYIGNNEEAVLVDAGISCREIEKRMHNLGLDPAKVKALFVSHEHTDHISGIPTLIKKYRWPLYITERTYRNCGFTIDAQFIRSFTAFEPVQIGALAITAFPKWHDAIDPHSFVISYKGITTGVFTDIGAACKNVISFFKLCHAVFLETNYDEAMLASSHYPVSLRNRISSKYGHLSNAQAMELFLTHKPAHMSHVFLSHLSKENNHPDVATALFAAKAGTVNIVHASRHEATAVYAIGEAGIPVAPRMQLLRRKMVKHEMQLKLF
ncbi:MAG: MBL fold metallo-hydrolase [Chitinophagaceae bacterium]